MPQTMDIVTLKRRMSQLFGIHEYRTENDQSDTVIQAGPFSTVSRTYGSVAGLEPRWLAVKAASIHRNSAKEPHDIIKEFRLLSSLSDVNIIEIFHRERSTHTLMFWMPYIPYALVDLLASPLFSPYPSPLSSLSLSEPGSPAVKKHQNAFTTLSKSLIFQLISALAYLDSQDIAHRDIKPSNVLITSEGCVKLIDFGISYAKDESEEVIQGDLWPEYSDKLYFEVSTGPYRAPELLFGTRSYDTHAIDLWSLGATIAEFFTPLQLFDDDDEDIAFPFPSSKSKPSVISTDDDDDAEEDSPKPLQPFILPSSPTSKSTSFPILSPRSRWTRHSLFDASRGEIGLAWSIFRIRGTPNEEVWPGFSDLPDAQRVTFVDTPRVPLRRFLPNLPPHATEGQEDTSNPEVESREDTPLDLIESLIPYPPSSRLVASEALKHPWFTTSPPILLPPSYSISSSQPATTSSEWEGSCLSQLLRKALGPSVANAIPPVPKSHQATAGK